jgi:hypothetical protein
MNNTMASPSPATYFVTTEREFIELAVGMYYETEGRRYTATFTIPTTAGTTRRTVTLSREYLGRIARDAENDEDIVPTDYAGGSDPASLRRQFAETTGPVEVLLELIEESRQTRPTGEFFPFVCKGEFTENRIIRDVLTKLQIFTPKEYESDTRPPNFNTPCLVNALEVAGVEPKIIAEIKPRFRRAKVSRTNISKVVEGHDICISIRTDESDKRIYIGDKTHPMYNLALINGHYIAEFDTGITPFALKNYSAENASKYKNWLERVSYRQRDPRRTMNISRQDDACHARDSRAHHTIHDKRLQAYGMGEHTKSKLRHAGIQ